MVSRINLFRGKEDSDSRSDSFEWDVFDQEEATESCAEFTSNMDVLFSIITKEVVELKEDRLEAKDLKVQVDICRAEVTKSSRRLQKTISLLERKIQEK